MAKRPQVSDGQSFTYRVIVSAALGAAVVVFLGLHTANLGLTVDTTTIGLLVLLIIAATIPFADSITFPGGGGVQFTKQVQAKTPAAVQTASRLHRMAATVNVIGPIQSAIPDVAERSRVLDRLHESPLLFRSRATLDWAANVPVIVEAMPAPSAPPEASSMRPDWLMRLHEMPGEALGELSTDLDAAKQEAVRLAAPLEPRDLASIGSIVDLCAKAEHVAKLNPLDAQVLGNLGQSLLQGLQDVIRSKGSP